MEEKRTQTHCYILGERKSNIMNKEIYKAAQRDLKLQGYYKGKIDGDFGPMSKAALSQYIATQDDDKPSDIKPPKSDYISVCKVFGQPGDESKLVRMIFPYRMTYAGQTVKTTRVHKLIKKPLLAALNAIHDELGMDFIKEHGLDIYDGCFNDRSSRNSNARSKHAWGIAIDLNAKQNRNRQPWVDGKQDQLIPGSKLNRFATMPTEAIEIFERFGFTSGARIWGKDAMHFQFCQ
jgi:hypothetical protein